MEKQGVNIGTCSRTARGTTEATSCALVVYPNGYGIQLMLSKSVHNCSEAQEELVKQLEGDQSRTTELQSRKLRITINPCTSSPLTDTLVLEEKYTWLTLYLRDCNLVSASIHI